MNELSWSVAPISGYMVVDDDVLVPFGSITRDSAVVAIRGAPWSPREALDLSERMESKDITEGVFERLGKAMCSGSLQETMGVAMR